MSVPLTTEVTGCLGGLRLSQLRFRLQPRERYEPIESERVNGEQASLAYEPDRTVYRR